jgi:hypothetical protein
MMYHNHRHPWRSAILFMRLNVPARMPDVSANASFCMFEKKKHVVNQSAIINEGMSDACVDDDDRRCVPTDRCTDRDRAWEGEGGRGRAKETHHLTELDGRVAYLIPNPNRDLNTKKKKVWMSVGE